MPRQETIICPTDLSPEADVALGHAAAIAVARKAKLAVVFHRPAPLDGDGASPAKLFEESIALNVPPHLLDALEWEGKVVTGETVGEAITHEAAVRAASLIVMRSRHRPLGAALLGSTAEAVCRTAPCPVLVTHPGERHWLDTRTGETTIRRILVGYDFWDDSEIALQQALAFASAAGAEVHILHAVPNYSNGSSEISWTPNGSESAIHRVASRLERAVPATAARGVRVFPHVRVGQPYREILAFADANEIDLICMGARGRDFGVRSLFGSNSDRVLRQAVCPVLVARPLKPHAAAIPGEGTASVSSVRQAS